MHQPQPLSEAPSLVGNVLATEARRHRLLIIAGAGISAAPPTNLPSGADVAKGVVDRLSGEVSFPDEEHENLLAIGDRLETLPGGAARLQQILLDVAPFTTAPPNFSHRALALMIAEGAAPVMLFNWDDCVERAGEPQCRIQAVVNNSDAHNITPPRDYKLHGSARSAGSLLVSSAQLAAPPTWAIDSVRAELASGSVLFLGVGDIPPYIQKRIEQLKTEVQDVSGVWVAAQGISAQWDDLIPDLPNGQKVEADANPFLDDLVRAYCRLVLSDVEEAATAAATSGGALADATAGFSAVRQAMFEKDGVWLLEVAFASALDWPLAEPVFDSVQMRRALVALSILATRGTFSIGGDEHLRLGDHRLELVVARDNAAPGSVAEAAERRVRDQQQQGARPFAQETLVLSAGHMGQLPDERLLRDVSSSSDPEAGMDLIEATTAGRIRFLDAGRITSGDVPALAA